MENPISSKTKVSGWKTLYRVGAIAILIAVIFFRRYYGAELSAFDGFGIYAMPETEPVSALEWFQVLQDYPYVGLSWLGLRDLVNYVLVGLFFLALYAALREFSPSLTMIAIAGGLIGGGVYLATNQAFALKNRSMLFILILIRLITDLYDLPNLLSGGALSSALLVIAIFVLLYYLPAIYTLRFLWKDIRINENENN